MGAIASQLLLLPASHADSKVVDSSRACVRAVTDGAVALPSTLLANPWIRENVHASSPLPVQAQTDKTVSHPSTQLANPRVLETLPASTTDHADKTAPPLSTALTHLGVLENAAANAPVHAHDIPPAERDSGHAHMAPAEPEAGTTHILTAERNGGSGSVHVFSPLTEPNAGSVNRPDSASFGADAFEYLRRSRDVQTLVLAYLLDLALFRELLNDGLHLDRRQPGTTSMAITHFLVQHNVLPPLVEWEDVKSACLLGDVPLVSRLHHALQHSAADVVRDGIVHAVARSQSLPMAVWLLRHFRISVRSLDEFFRWSPAYVVQYVLRRFHNKVQRLNDHAMLAALESGRVENVRLIQRYWTYRTQSLLYLACQSGSYACFDHVLERTSDRQIRHELSQLQSYLVRRQHYSRTDMFHRMAERLEAWERWRSLPAKSGTSCTEGDLATPNASH